MKNQKQIVLASAIMSLFSLGCNKLAISPAVKFIPPASIERASAAIAGTTYYVSNTGSDSNNGTSPSTPWKTIAKVNSHTYNANDGVLFNGGQTFTGNVVVNSSGSVSGGTFLYFGSYGTGQATISAGTGNGFYVYDKSNIWVDNLIVTGGWNSGSQSGSTGTGIYYYNDLAGAQKLGYCKVTSCNVSGFEAGGVNFLSYPNDNSQSGYDYIVVTGNSIHDNGLGGMLTSGPSAQAGSTVYAFTQVYIGYNKVYNNYGVKSHLSTNCGNGIVIGDAAGGTIEHNVTSNNGWYNSGPNGGPCGLWCFDANALIFQYNEAYDNGTGAGTADGDGFDLDGGATNCIMQYNYSHHNYAAGFLDCEYGDTRTNNNGNIFRYNISQGDGYGNSYYGSITLYGNSNHNSFYNNTIYSPTSLCVATRSGVGNGFYNNIFYDNSSFGTIYCSAGISSAYFLSNDYYAGSSAISLNYNGTVYNSLASFRSVTYNEVASGVNYGYSVNPLLSSAGTGGTFDNYYPNTLTSYQLAAASPMINKGYNLTTWSFNVGTADFNGSGIPTGGAYDIGACEYH
jgi:hypothetical protein